MTLEHEGQLAQKSSGARDFFLNKFEILGFIFLLIFFYPIHNLAYLCF